jgi:hypothetical protein
MTERKDIVEASTHALEARLADLLGGANPDFPSEAAAIEEELEWRRQRIERITQQRGD